MQKEAPPLHRMGGWEEEIFTSRTENDVEIVKPRMQVLRLTFGDHVTRDHVTQALQASSPLPNSQQRDLLYCLFSHAFRIETLDVRISTSPLISF